MNINAVATSQVDIFSNYPAHKRTERNVISSFDAISISDEAKQAYNNYILEKAADSYELNNDIINKLNSWFNTWHAGANFTTNTCGKSDYTSEIMSNENLELKNSIEKQIDKIISEYNYDQFSVAPQEMINRLRPLQQKLNAISALGGTMQLNEETLNSASNYLQQLENEWKNNSDRSTSLTEQFRSIKNNNFRGNMTQEEINERIRKIQEESLYSLTI